MSAGSTTPAPARQAVWLTAITVTAISRRKPLLRGVRWPNCCKKRETRSQTCNSRSLANQAPRQEAGRGPSSCPAVWGHERVPAYPPNPPPPISNAVPRTPQWLLRTMEHVQSMDFPACELQLDDSRFAADLTDSDRAHEILAGKGLCCEDKPFRPCLTLQDPDATLAAIGLPVCANSVVKSAMQALVANLIWLVQSADGAWIFYSRDNDHYAEMGRYVPDFYRRMVMVDAVALLEDAGLIVHERTRPNPRALYRSRIRPTDSLRARICGLPIAATVSNPREIIVLRGADGYLLQYRETASTCAMRRDVMAQNAFLERFKIKVCHPEARYDALGLLVIGDLRLNPGRRAYHRVFNGRFTRGGRWFGPWWQSVPSRVRQGIYVNGEPTSEPDIQGCHMRLLCARAGVVERTQEASKQR
jgi:hypothetical protein